MEKPIWERHSFFKVMIGDFRTNLRIPPCFHKHLMGKILVKFVLRIRDGRRWAVMLKREGGSLFFAEGWECFVADLTIQLGEFLLFVYDGDLVFDVKIYGITGCEKENLISSVKVEVDEEREIRKELPDEKNTRLIRDPRRRREVLNGHIILGGLQVFRNERALKAARSFKSKCPFFIATYRSSRQEYMTIPVSFLRECDLEKKEAIILQDKKGRSWPVRIAHWIGRVALANGWSKFRNGNHLKAGDVCVFEFLVEDKAILIHIFRAKEKNAAVLRRAGKAKPNFDGEEERISLWHQNYEFTSVHRKCEAEVLKAEKSFKPSARFASMFLKSRKYAVNIPTRILKDFDVRNISKTTLRDPSGRSWAVDIKQRRDGRAVLSVGWYNFRTANDIQENDICIFELTDGLEAMDVHIRRPGPRAITSD